MADQEQLRRRMAMEEEEAAEAAPGQPGPDPYAKGQTEKQRAQANAKRTGTPVDAAKSWANRAALGAGPQIAGAMGAAASMLDPKDSPQAANDAFVNAYRDVRDDTAKDLASSADTLAGDIGGAVGAMSTPGLPAIAKNATIPQRALQAGKVGGTVGALNAAFTSPTDLTQADAQTLKQFLLDTGVGMGGGALGGGLAGGALGGASVPARAVAETQALRAAGLRGGIKNSIHKDLGVPNMGEARQIGRQFLDEELIPPVGSSEAVGKLADALRAESGNSIGSVMTQADLSGVPANEAMTAQAMRDMLAKESAPADLLSGGKARSLADAMEAQGDRTPGSFTGLNKAKSDAWRSADFRADPDMAAELYRKAVGAGRDDIARQIEAAIGPDAAAQLRAANEKFGVASDALKLAENASTRDAAKKGLGMPEVLALMTGMGGGVAGHPIKGGLAGLGIALGTKALDKYGHSTAARGADFLANRSGGGVGGQAGASVAKDKLAPWLQFIGEDEERP